MARNVLAMIAALAMLTPGVCVCGCPCEMLLAGEFEPTSEGEAPAPSCCHPAPPSGGPILAQPHDCCCDAQRPPIAEATPTTVTPADASSPVLLAVVVAVDPFVLEIDARTGPDPPAAARGPVFTSLHAVLRT